MKEVKIPGEPIILIVAVVKEQPVQEYLADSSKILGQINLKS